MTKTIKSIQKYKNKEQIKDWGHLGEILKGNNVRHIYFAHGTFVGDDSLGIINLFSPLLGSIVSGRLETLAKKGIDLVLDDVGNYTDQYTEAFKESIGNGIACERFSWNGGNYHLARLRGALDLINVLAKNIIPDHESTNDHVWLTGHSHAGQLFALFTIFLSGSARAGKLLKIADKLSKYDKRYAIKILKNSLKQIKESNVHFDIATFGTPPRYPWGKCENYSLINVINDRSDDLSDVSISDLLSTRDGDYVQQWGGTGTDLIAPSIYEIELNEKLDEILKNEGHDLSEALGKLKVSDRIIPNKGNTVLVDYGDRASSILYPNCITSIFGHGAYTKHEFMFFNTLLLVNEFYGSDSNSSTHSQIEF